MNGAREGALRTSEDGGGGGERNVAFAAPLPPRPPVPALAEVNALDAVSFRLVEGPCDVEGPSFGPSFAHQHFPPDEVIRGFPGLRIDHFYAAASLRLFTRISCDAQQPGCVPPDVGAALRVYMPDADCEPEAAWASPSLDDLVESAARDCGEFVPPGEQVASYEAAGRRFQVRLGSFADARVRRYHQRMRPFLIWFVDAANFINDRDQRWDLFMLFREPVAGRGGSWALCGFATCYSFFSWSGKVQRSEAPERGVEAVVAAWQARAPDAVAGGPRWYERRFRISQFLILPPFQRAGHGVRLLETLYGWAAVARAPLRDITVEDPSPSFVAMRDYCDLTFLMERGLVRGGAPGTNDVEALSRCLREKRFVCAPQIARVVQLVRWMEACWSDEAARKAMRVEIKQRLYRENSADIPADDVTAAVAELWAQEEAAFNATLLRLKLIN